MTITMISTYLDSLDPCCCWLLIFPSTKLSPGPTLAGTRCSLSRFLLVGRVLQWCCSPLQAAGARPEHLRLEVAGSNLLNCLESPPPSLGMEEYLSLEPDMGAGGAGTAGTAGVAHTDKVIQIVIIIKS